MKENSEHLLFWDPLRRRFSSGLRLRMKMWSEALPETSNTTRWPKCHMGWYKMEGCVQEELTKNRPRLQVYPMCSVGWRIYSDGTWGYLMRTSWSPRRLQTEGRCQNEGNPDAITAATWGRHTSMYCSQSAVMGVIHEWYSFVAMEYSMCCSCTVEIFQNRKKNINSRKNSWILVKVFSYNETRLHT